MAYLSVARKSDLIELADELGVEISEESKVIDIRRKIQASENYVEEEVKISLTRIIEDRKEREQWAKMEAEEKRQEEEFARQEKIRQHEIEMKKLEITTRELNPTSSAEDEPNRNRKIQFSQITSKFDEKKDEMGLYLVNFERKAEMAHVPKGEWVAYLLAVLPPELSNMLAREPLDIVNDYDKVKELILKRYKMNAEKLKQCFYRHRKAPEKTWRNYAYELQTYFTEWLAELKIETFEQLRDLIVAEQLKYRVPEKTKEHFLDQWMKINTPFELAEMIEEYESVRESFQRKEYPMKPNYHAPRGYISEARPNQVPKGHFSETKPKVPFKRETEKEVVKPEPRNNEYQEREFERRKELRCYQCGSIEHLRPQCPKLKPPEVISAIGIVGNHLPEYMSPFSSTGRVNGTQMSILRDTGATIDLIPKKYVKPHMYTGEQVWVMSPITDPVCLPIAEIDLKCELGHVITKAAVKNSIIDQYLLSNKTVALIESMKADKELEIQVVNAVQTRAQRKNSEQTEQKIKSFDVFENEDLDSKFENTSSEEIDISPPRESEPGIPDLLKTAPEEYREEQNHNGDLTEPNSLSDKKTQEDDKDVDEKRMLFLKKKDKDKSERNQKLWHDKNSVKGDFEIGDPVLVIAPSKTSKLSETWISPGKVESPLSETRSVNISLLVEDKEEIKVEDHIPTESSKLDDVNLTGPDSLSDMKTPEDDQYVDENSGKVESQLSQTKSENISLLVEDKEEIKVEDHIPTESSKFDDVIEIVRENAVTAGLNSRQREELLGLLERFSHIFSNLPDKTQMVEQNTGPISNFPHLLKTISDIYMTDWNFKGGGRGNVTEYANSRLFRGEWVLQPLNFKVANRRGTEHIGAG